MAEFPLVVIVWLALNPLYYVVPLGILLAIAIRWHQSDDSDTETHR